MNIMGPQLKLPSGSAGALTEGNENGDCDGEGASAAASDDGSADFELLKSVLSDAIALGAIKSCIFDHR